MATAQETTTPSETQENKEDTSATKGENQDSLDVQQDGDEEVKYPSWPKRFRDVQPRIQDCNYHQFKNFVNESEMNAAVYALWGSRHLKNDIKKEKAWRKTMEKSSRAHDPREFTKGSGKETDGGESGDSVESKVLHRIRIHSAYILKQLSKLTDFDNVTERPLVFFRPFRILVHLQPQMREILADLRKKWEETSNTATNDTQEDVELESSDPDFGSIELLDSKHALDHMEVYVKFIDDQVMVLGRQFTAPNSNQTKIAFDDLSYLFREGQYVYRPLPSSKGKSAGANSTSSSMSSTYQQLWRVYSTVIPYVADDPEDAALADLNNNGEQVDSDCAADAADEYIANMDNAFQIFCYYIDFDGQSYCPAHQCISIKKYEGERTIKSLPIYPTTYLGDEHAVKEVLDKHQKLGEDFMGYIRQRHVYHFGWTVSHHPTGASIIDGEKYPEFIDSEFIIDFQEAYQTSPFWKSDNSYYTPGTYPSLSAYLSIYNGGESSVQTLVWSRNSKDKNVHRHDDADMVDGDNVGSLRRNEFILNNAFLSASRRGDFREPQGTEICLLPKRLVGFALRERKFVNVSISSIKHIKEESAAFNLLQLDPGHKTMVRSLVMEHFRLKKRRERGDESVNQDVIKGKGTGLVFLLHGVPGVGKTATAEAIAQENRTPLFSITCGDLGIEPSEVERNLTRIFRWATIWGCILLLDEADVFFTRRNPSDLQRNALVTVFLRILEYYGGILFLTTNRVGIMDEAFKSRIHMSLYYPPLGLKQTLQIFATNIDRLEAMEAAETDESQAIVVERQSIMDWAEQHFLQNPELGRWNGRQIRNAFQTAASLAHYDKVNPGAAEDGAKPGVLNWIQFKKVAQATRQFDEYMTVVRRATDGESARKEGIRRDDHTAMPHAQHHRDIPSMSQPRPIHTSQDALFPSVHPHSQYPPQESIYSSPDYSRGTSSQAYNRAATATPSRAPPAAHMGHQPDSGISLEFGYRAQVIEHGRDERPSPNFSTPVRQSYGQPDEYDARPYRPSPAQAAIEGLPPGYQGYQTVRHVGNAEQGIWEGSRG